MISVMRIDLSVFCHAGDWQWESINGSVHVPLSPSSVPSLVSSYDLCVTGEGLNRLTYDPRVLNALLPHVRVFARVSPKQKVIFRNDYICSDTHVAVLQDCSVSR